MEQLNTLLKQFKLKGYKKYLPIFEQAFTHSSYNSDAKTKNHDYERLEFLGDSVIGNVVAEQAYKLHPEMDQGLLSKLRSSIVSTHPLADLARKYHFEKYIKVGKSFERNVSEADSLLEDVFEAFVGAVFLTCGYTDARRIVIDSVKEKIVNVSLENLTDYKSKLQEAIQAEHRETINYEVTKESGPAHARVFEVVVKFDNMILGHGVGTSKKAAEQAAAKDALNKKAS